MQFGLQEKTLPIMDDLAFFSWFSKAKQRYDDLTFCTGGDLCLGQKPPIDSQRVHTKGQIISKCLFGVFNFFQKTNENISHTSKNEFIHSFF